MSGLEDTGASKLQRWQRILQEAAEQCGRSRLPRLLPIRPLALAINDIPPGAIALMPWEEERGLSLREALQRNVATPLVGVESALRESAPQSVAPPLVDVAPNVREAPTVTPPPSQPLTVVLFIGPEGGLMTEEVQLAQRHGVRTVTLGPRILRAETAAIATVANVMYELEALYPL
jgi:16S rRNA (uracil1498-N3)-methyltransferase